MMPASSPRFNIPPYTRELAHRLAGIWLSARTDERNWIRIRQLLVVFVFGLGVCLYSLSPLYDVFNSVGAGTEDQVTRAQNDAMLIKALRDFSERLSLACVALGSALSASVLLLQSLWGLTDEEAINRTLMTLGLGQVPRFAIHDGIIVGIDRQQLLDVIGGTCLLSVGSNTAVIIERAGKFCAVHGPGNHYLQPFERIFELVDLRPRIINHKISTQTKDGIPIVAEGEVEFQVRPATEAQPTPLPLPFSTLMYRVILEWQIVALIALHKTKVAVRISRNINRLAPAPKPSALQRAPYPFDKDDIVNIAFRQSMRRKQTRDGDKITWEQRVPSIASANLRNELSMYTLDRLTEPEDAPADRALASHETPLRRIQAQVIQKTGDAAQQWSCRVIRYSLGRITLDADKLEEDLRRKIENQRTRTWKEEWIRRAAIVESEAESEAERLRQTARADAQARMIRSILEGLPPDADVRTMRQLVLARTITALEEIRLDPQVQQFIPSETLRTLDLMRRIID